MYLCRDTVIAMMILKVILEFESVNVGALGVCFFGGAVLYCLCFSPNSQCNRYNKVPISLMGRRRCPAGGAVLPWRTRGALGGWGAGRGRAGIGPAVSPQSKANVPGRSLFSCANPGGGLFLQPRQVSLLTKCFVT